MANFGSNKTHLQGNFSDHKQLDTTELPPKVDLRPYMTPVKNQLKTSAVVANALAGAYEYLVKKSTGTEIAVSRLFIYYNARVRAQNSSEHIADRGSTMADDIKALEEFGVCLETVWPFNVDKINARPTDEAYETAKNNKILDALEIQPALDEMKTCLAQGYPFIFGLTLFKSFGKTTNNGVILMPTSEETVQGFHSRHVMLAVGYSDRLKSFIVQNSWGSDWGDQGYCYIPYDYVTDPSLCFGGWIIRNSETDDVGHEHWVQDD